MRNISSHINYTKGVILMLMALFALTPCSVKESAYQLINVEYQRPLNQTKSTQVNNSSCEVSEMEDGLIVATTQSNAANLLLDIEPGVISTLTPLLSTQVFTYEYLSSQPSTSFAPLYILYSRLKIALA